MSFLMSKPKVQGPQSAAALSIQQSSYGTPLVLVYGTNRVFGNLLWYGAFQANLVSTGGGGGKGGVVGGGGKGGGQQEYNYYASFDIGLCEGPVSSIGQVFVSKQITTLATLNGQEFNGAQGQAPPGYMTTNFPAQALGYSETCHILFPNFSLGTSSETPQFSFETFGLKVFGNGIQDASPDQMLIDFLGRCGLPTGYIDTFAACATYWQATGFFISPMLDQQRQASDWLKEFMATLNAEFVWLPSQGVLSGVPYGDTPASANGVNYVPNFNPIYSLGDDDFIRDGDVDPVTVTRESLSDVYNIVPIEYVNRGDQYNVETYEAFDDALVDTYGPRVAPTLRAHHVTDPVLAQTMVNLWMNRQIYVQKKYSFKLPWNYVLLDPLDIVEITDVNLGLVNALVRITSIEEDEKTGMLAFEAEEIPNAIAGSLINPNFGVTRYTPNYNLDPGNVNAPIFFESPLALMQTQSVVVNIALSGASEMWGGCNVYVSTDGVTYGYLDQFNSKSRMGTLTAALPNFTPASGGSNVDTSSILSVAMTESDGSFNNAATNADATNLNTLCYVDGELIAFGSDVLTGQNAYNLSYLNRGCYGSTIGAHAVGSSFARFDDGIFQYAADQTYLGKTLYFKFCSYNAWGGGLQALNEVEAYTYTVLGTALLTPFANPSMVAVYYNQFLGQLYWTGISDIRTPLYYEIRKGSGSFAKAAIVGVTSETSFDVYGSDTYWVSALYFTPLGVPVYSSSPPSIVVSTPSVPLNIIDEYDEAANNFPGACSGGAAYTSTGTGGVPANSVYLASSDILGVSNIVTDTNILLQSGVISPGTYTSAETFTSNYVVNAKVMFNYTLEAINVVNPTDIVGQSDIVSLQDILGGASPSLINAQVQIKLSTTGSGGLASAAWQNWTPGFYTFNAMQYRIVLSSTSSQVTAILTAFSATIDVPQYVQSGSLTTGSGGSSTVTFTSQFNAVPVVNVQIVNAQAGDLVVMGTPTETSFTVGVVNSGSNVVRSVTWTATSF